MSSVTRCLAMMTLMCLMLSCSPPADPLAYGRLCLPARVEADGQVSCPSQVSFQRPNPFGRNAIDFSVTNLRDLEVEAIVLAGPAELFVSSGVQDMGPDSGDMQTTEDNNLDIFQFLGLRTYQPLKANEVIRDRFVPSELGRSREVSLALDCGGLTPTLACDIELDYVFVVEPNECAANEDCDGLWICDTSRGECVECQETSQCSEGQTCELGRCTPERVTSTCATTQARPPLGGLVLVLFVGIGLWGMRRLRRRGLRPRRAAMLVLLVMSATLCGASPTEKPITAQSAHVPVARFDLSLGPRFFTGQLGELTDVGLGFGIRQGLRGRYLGADLTLTAAYFSTRQPAPPSSRSLITYSAQVGPRGYLPLGPIELFAGGSYERLGLAANSLVRITGESLSYNALDATVGVHMRVSSLEFELEGQYHWLFGLPGQMISVGLTVGFIGGQ